MTLDGATPAGLVPAGELRLLVRGYGDPAAPPAILLHGIGGDSLELDRVTLIGHSMGGLVALVAAQLRPDRIDALVIEEAPPPVPLDRPPLDPPAERIPNGRFVTIPAGHGIHNEGFTDYCRTVDEFLPARARSYGAAES